MNHRRTNCDRQIKNPSINGFTLVEIIISTIIMGAIIAAAVPFAVQSLKLLEYSANKVVVNRNIRELTSSISKEGSSSFGFSIYSSYDEFRSDNGNFIKALPRGQSGNLIVFRHRDTSRNIIRMVGYYLSTTTPSTAENAIRKFDRKFDPNTITASTNLSDYFPPRPENESTHPVQVILAKPIGSTGLFYNLNDKSLKVKTEMMLHVTKNTNLDKIAINSYSFIVTPRNN